MAPTTGGGGGVIAGAALVSAVAISSSSSSWSDTPYSHDATIPITASTVTRILERCSLTSIAEVSDSNAARRLHCLAALSEAAIDKHYKRPFFAKPFTKRAAMTIVLIVSALIMLLWLAGVCVERFRRGGAKKREEEIALARARLNRTNTLGS
ncbi:hypothetical protein BOTCAL_0081g00080 [Botryotinia calthae]|uniref:Uncharacterized protein n=1 Tax=Botryotinia calthae TaxID=38488 RepID=A0A4Y8DA90_9HELO|nr:hypothetical protein BOTCAL_0081g00080 [Botryotinia calthae]